MSFIVFVAVFGGALFGLFLRQILPGHHLSNDAKEAVKLGAGLVATLTALVLGLLISSAKDSFDTTNTMVQQSSAKILAMDRILANYGPEAVGIRSYLKEMLRARITDVWPEAGRRLLGKAVSGKMNVEKLQMGLRNLIPKSDLQRDLQKKVIEISYEMAEMRWLIFEQLQTTLPPIFLAVLIFWLAILFACFGLLAARNGTVIAVFFVCAISVAGGIFLILEMGKPLSGAMKIPAAPMVKTYEHLGK